MQVNNHLINDIKPLKITEKVEDVMALMSELKCGHLPVIEDQRYLGLISEDDLLDVEDPTDTLGEHLKVLKPYALKEEDHLYDAVKVMSEGNLTCLPVLNKEGKYLGYLSPQELVFDLGRQVTYLEHGSVVVLRVAIRDYHISQISQIVESEDAFILGLQLHSDSDDYLKVVLKINQTDLSRIIKAFSRYEYQVLSVFHQSLFEDDGPDPFETLEQYLNI